MASCLVTKLQICDRCTNPFLQAVAYLGVYRQRIDSIAKNVTADQVFNQHRSNEIPVFGPIGEQLARSQVMRLQATTGVAPGTDRIADRHRAAQPPGRKRGSFNRYPMNVKAVHLMESRKLTQGPIDPVYRVRSMYGLDIDLDRRPEVGSRLRMFSEDRLRTEYEEFGVFGNITCRSNRVLELISRHVVVPSSSNNLLRSSGDSTAKKGELRRSL